MEHKSVCPCQESIYAKKMNLAKNVSYKVLSRHRWNAISENSFTSSSATCIHNCCNAQELWRE